MTSTDLLNCQSYSDVNKASTIKTKPKAMTSRPRSRTCSRKAKATNVGIKAKAKD